MSGTKLVIVESPAKARTISNYLGASFQVNASVGHIRDLAQPSQLPADMKKGPYGRFAVNIEDNFEPYYLVDSDKKKKVAELKRELKEADELYLATDEDREGEAIAWHLIQVLQPKVPVKRMVFHEITREAIERALENTRDIDKDLVDAQETRRILDRLYGYEVSPLLWRKIKPGLSAGRVQSVATRMLVDRERERMAFISAEYWDILAYLATSEGDTGTQPGFEAKAIEVNGVKIATGRDFGDDGTLTPSAKKNGVVALDQKQALALGETLRKPETTWTVNSVETKPYTRRPAPPFTTSTLQQEASRKLRVSSREAMRTAQTLYENGYITYMRTDSVALSAQAVNAARSQASKLYGADTVPDKPRVYATKTKGAQEAHEAIRPAGDHFRTPDQVKDSLSPAELALYTLIWKRTLASQMTDAKGTTNTVRVGAANPGLAGVVDGGAGTSSAGNSQMLFSAAGTVITHRGFMAAYEEGRDASQYDGRGDGDADDKRLPALDKGQELRALEVDTSEDRRHKTSPPPRFTEASLVKAMEERGIGRPSTYASTISTITDRGYVSRRGQALSPTWVAFSVTRLLEENLGDLVDYDFTATMEEDLDRIAEGVQDRVTWLRAFFLGDNDRAGLQAEVAGLGDIDAHALNATPIAEGVTLRVGRYGPFLEAGDRRASVPDELPPDELTAEKAQELLTAAADDGRELGVHPETGRMLVAKAGRFGPYITEVIPEDPPSEEETDAAAGTGAKKPARKKAAAKVKPRTASLFKSMSLATVTLEDAVQLLSLPRVVGVSADGVEITAQNGRYGPYLKKGTDSRSLTEESQLLTLTLEEAEAIYAQPKTRGRAAAKPPLLEFGEDPVSGKKVVVKDGRFGPYVTDGTTNVTVPRSVDPATLTESRAFELLAEKRAKGPVTKKAPARKKPAAKKAPAKRATAAKKPAAKKSASKE
ncbi:MAG: type I DNA topoisomerase [Actinomycetaceae bacterium]|nr:type I DNA topoisomerase [Actinomycetaceae bacterium]